MTIRSYRDLNVWRKGMSLAEAVYRLTATFPRDEQYGLTSQSRRASVSIPANIAEGYGRGSRASYAAFVKIAQGSLKELETHLLLSARIGITSEPAIQPLLDEADQLGKMLRSLLASLQKSPMPGPNP